MKNTFLVITSIADDKHPILNKIAKESKENNVNFILIGDTKSPEEFELKDCDFYSASRQTSLNLKLAKTLPFKHYARKNIGYLLAIKGGAEVIIETDDDNIPLKEFWEDREKNSVCHKIEEGGWVNVYKYFSEKNIWPRGFSLEDLKNGVPKLQKQIQQDCPIQQGLADENPDVDAIYRMTLPLPINFNKNENILLGRESICPFNSQNTTWFQEAFPLMYLPSYCSFRMTDIWRSFVAQRVAWECNWGILFHSATVKQERNGHSLLKDFEDEVIGYTKNKEIMDNLVSLKLKNGEENILDNMTICYKKLVEMGLVGEEEIELLGSWGRDLDIN